MENLVKDLDNIGTDDRDSTELLDQAASEENESLLIPLALT